MSSGKSGGMWVQNVDASPSDRWDLTRDEYSALDAEVNLCDAHNRMAVSPGMQQALTSGLLNTIWQKAERERYTTLTREFLSNYSCLSGSGLIDVPLSNIHVCYASSVAMSILASALRGLDLSVTLLEPTFDNIPDLLKLGKVRVKAKPEHEVFNAELETVDTDCLYLVNPNNPTGSGLCADKVRQVFFWANLRERIVIIDRSFALFDEDYSFDVYTLAREFPKLVLLVIEDTGKIFPCLDQKVGFLVMPQVETYKARSLHSALAVNHSAVLLNVSPFTLALLSEFCVDAASGGLDYVRAQTHSQPEGDRCGECDG